jgi:hypothetical protein
MLRLLVTANVVPISPIFVTLMMEEIRSFETSVHTRSTQRNIPEHCILHLFVLATLIVHLATLSVCLFTLSSAGVGALVIGLSDSSCEE